MGARPIVFALAAAVCLAASTPLAATRSGVVERTSFSRPESSVMAVFGDSSDHGVALTAGLGSLTDTLTCGQEIQKDDKSTGILDLRFQCFGDSGVVNWGFTLSPQVKALIGPENEPVSESGMVWFRNGERQPRNAAHRAASTYQFHGTINPTAVNDRVDYQDQFEFSTTDGRTGTVIVAGTLYLKA